MKSWFIEMLTLVTLLTGRAVCGSCGTLFVSQNIYIQLVIKSKTATTDATIATIHATIEHIMDIFADDADSTAASADCTVASVIF